VVSALDFKQMVVGSLCCPRMSPLLLYNSIDVGLLSCCRVARVVSALDFKHIVVGTLCCPGCLRCCWTTLLL